MSNQIWPSSQPSRQKATKSTYRGQKIPTAWAPSVMFLFVALAVVAVGAMVLWPLGVQMLDGVALISDKLSGMQLASAVTK